MPELPEVTTTVNGLNKTIKGLTIFGVWTDLAKDNPIKQFENTIKSKKFFTQFKKDILNQKIIKSERRAKNILISLSNNKIILIHLKMTGHLIYGKYRYIRKDNKWTPHEKERESLKDPYNRFIHFVIEFSNGKHLVFCDSRKFGKVTLINERDLKSSLHLKNIGPEPLEESFLFENFKERLYKKPNKNIKTVLMDQSVVAGVGNIYSDEMLWLAGIHPESHPIKIPGAKLLLLYKSMKDVLNKGIDFKGDSMSDYRNINGERGEFQNHHNVYQKKDERCNKKNCRGVIIRKVINGRGAHFCDTCQKNYK